MRERSLAEESLELVHFGGDFEALVENRCRVLDVAIVDDDFDGAECLSALAHHIAEAVVGFLERDSELL